MGRIRTRKMRMRGLNTRQKINRLGTACSIMLGLVMLVALCPGGSSDEANAVEERAAEGGFSIAVSVGSDATMNLTPSASGSVQTGSTTVNVSSTFKDGYKLYVAGSTSLTRQGTVSGEIKATSSNSTASNLANNTWGYVLTKSAVNASTTFKPMKSSQTQEVNTTTASTDTYNLGFATKVDNTLPAGRYTGDVTVSVITNPLIVTELSYATYMQDMTTSICSATKGLDGASTVAVGQEPSKRLIDKRDGKMYWVAKLADQNCWMTQNLDLDLTATGSTPTLPLKPETSDVSANWSPESETKVGTDYSGSANYTVTGSWDPGAIVLNNPTGSSGSCNSIKIGTSLTSCQWFTNVDNMNPTYTATTTSSVNGNTYDPHYLVGNYYQWNTATAGTGGTITSGQASSSICPKGWRLSTSGSNTAEFANLVKAYGYSGNDDDSITGSNKTRVDYKPIYFVRTGAILPGYYIYSAGHSGLYWSSIPSTDSSSAYFISINTSIINPSYSGVRGNGLSLRCLAR